MTEDDEIDAFFALPRRKLFIAAMIVLAVLLSFYFAAGWISNHDLRLWVIPALLTLVFLGMLRLSLTPAGRGCLYTIGFGWKCSERRWSPETQVVVSGALALIGIVIATWLTFS